LYKTRFEQGEKYVTIKPTKPPSELTLPLEQDKEALMVGPRAQTMPYNPGLDVSRFPSELFRSRMAGIIDRDTILFTERYWGRQLYLWCGTVAIPYWSHPHAVRSSEFRDQVREMVAILGVLVFKLVIWVS
jgi:hypothetical protein